MNNFRNLLIATIYSLVSLAFVLTFYLLLVNPIQEHEAEKFLEECSKRQVECVVDHNFMIPLVLGIIPFMIWMIVYNKLQNKDQQQAWRSYR